MAFAVHREGKHSLEHIKSFIKAEGVDCNFAATGRFHAAHNPVCYERLARTVAQQIPGLEDEAFMIPKAEQRSGLGTDHYFGGAVFPRHAALDPAAYHKGLLTKARAAGATVLLVFGVERRNTHDIQSADSPGQRHTHLQPPAPAATLLLMQPQSAFDTHAFVKSLTGAGMPEDQAEILAKGQSDLYERLVTREHLEQKLGTLELTLRNEIEKLRAELEQKFNQQEVALKEMEYKLTIRLGAMLTIGITILGALFTLLTTAAP